MTIRLSVVLLAGLVAILLSSAIPISAQEQTPDGSGKPAEQVADIPKEQLTGLVEDLEDPAEREKLVQQLKTLIQVEAANAEPASEIKSATTELLQTASEEVKILSGEVAAFARSLNALPQTWTWLEQQYQQPAARRLWTDVLINLSLVLGSGYLVYFVLYGLLRWPRRRLAQRSTRSHFLVRALSACVALLLEVLPLLAFAAAAYVMLGYVDPREQTRLVALAWINAALITRAIMAVGRLAFAPHSAELRLLSVDERSAHYAIVWIRRLAFTTVYGYFALQTAVLLGLPTIAHAALLRVLGLIVTGLVCVFLLQNRAPVAAIIRGQPSTKTLTGLRQLRRRLAQLWLPLAVLYVLALYGVWALDIGDGFMNLLLATLGTVLVLVTAYYLLRGLERISSRDFNLSEDLNAHYPRLKGRIGTYSPVLKIAGRVLIYAVAIVGVLQIWGLEVLVWLASEPGRILGRTAFTVAAIVLASLVIWEFTSSSIEHYLAEQERHHRTRARSNRTRTLLAVARNALLIALLVGSTLLVLAELGINIAPLLAGAGVLGLAVGFGSQQLVQDIITGFLILFEDMIAVGDVIEVGGKSGLVEAVTIRNVRLRDLAGTVHIIPFSAISTVSNLTKDYAYYVFDVGVAYREDTDHVVAVLKQIGAELESDPNFANLILEPLEIFGVDAFADSAVIIKARIKTRPIQQWNVGREFNRRMKKRFDELGIEIPFPHQTLYFGVDKQGNAHAAHLQIDRNRAVREPDTALGILASPQ
ncbi:MAG: mechanosensitive ion channel [Candidatus Competibacteraceae bacterium]